MTRTLILIRHAKSEWGGAGLDDHDRPLNGRGRLSAPRLGAWLTRRRAVPDGVLCSTARRTRETWAGIAGELPQPPEPVFLRGLYLAEPSDILTLIRTYDLARLAVVGHNPGIGALAGSLCAEPPDHGKFALYPTGATLILSFDVDHMSDIAPGAGRVSGFTVPRDLPDPA